MIPHIKGGDSPTRSKMCRVDFAEATLLNATPMVLDWNISNNQETNIMGPRRLHTLSTSLSRTSGGFNSSPWYIKV